MGDVGRHQNHAYTRNSISLFKYIDLALQNPLPVSGLYLWTQLAVSAYQLPEGASTRSTYAGGRLLRAAVRVPLWLPSADGLNLSITDYKSIPTLLHSTAPNVDRDRDLLKAQLEQSRLVERTPCQSWPPQLR
ncbi:hypothetical protein SAMN05444141_1021 [Pseudovibrio denitrificans]|uniref:Uncharacterized protein n=1 Tax=Pseudovibrio denitrificans TaxID=258256 RepID=A0A1I6Z1U2_9HYPH|nr:hypothetical protein [Pseudovibrio denitrificans]SFT56687.1 hypothetical protein SAMN05444141_1021 [Pseudovibrio denitrificans]